MKEAFEAKISHHNNIVTEHGRSFYILESKTRFKVFENIEKILANILSQPFMLLKRIPDLDVNETVHTFVDENLREIRLCSAYIYFDRK